MLGKLIKHEWKAVWKILTLLNAFTVLVTLIGCISLYSPLWKSSVEYIGVLGFSYLLLYYITIIVVSFSTLIFLAVRFYKNLYTDEGYLLHTLPVTTRDLIFSKGIVAFIWTLLTSLFIFLSVFLLGTIFVMNIDDGSTLSSIYNVIAEGIQIAFNTTVPTFILWMILCFIIGSLSSLSMIYGAISLGQLFHKHKVLGSFLCYIGIYMVMQTVTSVLIAPFTTRMILAEVNGTATSLSGFVNSLMVISLIPTAIIGIGLYFLTEYIMKRKLNLD